MSTNEFHLSRLLRQGKLNFSLKIIQLTFSNESVCEGLCSGEKPSFSLRWDDANIMSRVFLKLYPCLSLEKFNNEEFP